MRLPRWLRRDPLAGWTCIGYVDFEGVVIDHSLPTGRHRKGRPVDLPTTSNRRHSCWPGVESCALFCLDCRRLTLPRPAHRKETP